MHILFNSCMHICIRIECNSTLLTSVNSKQNDCHSFFSHDPPDCDTATTTRALDLGMKLIVAFVVGCDVSVI